jgi:hypothetical protein
VKGLEKANEIWEKLMEIYEGTSTVKEAKLYVYKGKFNEFTMKKDEDVSTMFNRLNDIVNELRCLDFNVTNKDFSHKFLRCLPKKYETIVTLLVRIDLNKMTPTEVLGEVQTHDLFKQSQKEVQGQSMSEEKKNISLKAKATQEENDDENQEIDSDEEMALIVRGLKRIMKKKKFGKMGQSSKKNHSEGKDCFNCGEIGHISINCLNKKEDKYGKKKDKKTRRVFLRGRNITRRRKMAKLTLLSGIPMQTPMKMMMTSRQGVLPGSLSRKLLHSSPSHIVSWINMNQR